MKRGVEINSDRSTKVKRSPRLRNYDRDKSTDQQTDRRADRVTSKKRIGKRQVRGGREDKGLGRDSGGEGEGGGWMGY